ncbi:MAG: TetR family transcriptional regulator [Hyphomicrobiaceae bacterium]
MPPLQEDRSARLATLSLEALETRNRILGEAERLFRVYGYSKTTVADIADACRMSPANVYRFFTSKSAINNAICERLIADDEDALRGIARLPLPASERLKRVVVELNRRSVQNFIDNKKVHEMVMVALEERWEAIREHIHRVRDLFGTIIRDGIDSGEFREQDVKRAAECACAAMAPLRHPVMLVQCMDDPDKPTPSEMADFIIQALK